MSCNELDNLQHNGQNVSTLNTTTHSTLLHDQLDSFSTNQVSMLNCFLDKCCSRCDAHPLARFIATHISVPIH